MKRLTIWDVIATFFVAAIAAPYFGYLVRGTMPFIQDPRGMAGTGLVLGAAAFVAAWYASNQVKVTKLEVGLGLTSLALGVAALAAAETSTADVLLAVFMGSIGVVWAEQLLQHAVIRRTGHGRVSLSH